MPRCLSIAIATIVAGAGLWTIAGAAELSPVKIQSQPQQPVTESVAKQTQVPLPPPPLRVLPAKAPVEVHPAEIQPLEGPPEPALMDFDVASEEELSRGPAEASPQLADATKYRMFAWRECDHYRAGCPLIVKEHFSMLSTNWRYQAYNVGGGSPFIGTGPSLFEGTWGMDYQGFFPKRVGLNWNHGQKYQGGVEGYKTDGPKHERK